MRLIDDDPEILEAFLNPPPAKHNVKPASDWTQAVIDHFYRPDDTPKIHLPWAKTFSDFHFRPAEVSLWGGINSHGKSMLVSQVMLNLMQQGETAGIASLEMAPVLTMARMQQQSWGGDQPSIDFIKRFGTWTDDKLWLYDHVGSVAPEVILAVIRYTVEKFKVQHFVVDNLSKVIDGDQGERVYNAQKSFVSALCDIANSTRTHIHLVAHMRKGEKETTVPGKFDVKGSGALTDLVDNVFIVWRNKAKEESIRQGDMSQIEDPDAILKIDKQRNAGIEGSYRLWFDPASCQYLPDRHTMASRMQIDAGISLDEADL